MRAPFVWIDEQNLGLARHQRNDFVDQSICMMGISGSRTLLLTICVLGAGLQAAWIGDLQNNPLENGVFIGLWLISLVVTDLHKADIDIRINSLAGTGLPLRLAAVSHVRACTLLVRQRGELLSTMSDPTTCKPSNCADFGTGSGVFLPTRQKNALRLLLDKRVITPEEVAALDYRTVERAPGIGKNSLEIIRAWLHSHGLDLRGRPTATVNPRSAQRTRKLERAIDYLRWHGYEVHRSR
jgi:hypothetical protein